MDQWDGNWTFGETKDKIRHDHRSSLWGREDTLLSSWVWYMNEVDHHTSVHLVFPGCVVILSLSIVLRCASGLCFQALLQRRKSNWAQLSCPWTASYNIFRISTRQMSPGCLYTSSPLELASSSLLHLSSSHWLTEACCLSPTGASLCSLVCSPFPLLCSWRMSLFPYLLYLPAGSSGCHYSPCH